MDPGAERRRKPEKESLNDGLKCGAVHAETQNIGVLPTDLRACGSNGMAPEAEVLGGMSVNL